MVFTSCNSLYLIIVLLGEIVSPLKCLISIVEATISRGQPAGLAELKRLADGNLFTAEATEHYHECRANPNAPANFKPILLNAAVAAAAPPIREINAAHLTADDDELLLQLASKFVNDHYDDVDPPCEHSHYRDENEAFNVPITTLRKWLIAQQNPRLIIDKLLYQRFAEHLTSILKDNHLQINPIARRPNDFATCLKSNVVI